MASLVEVATWLALGAYWFSSAGLALLGLYYLVIVALRPSTGPPLATAAAAKTPSVTVQIPMRNERHVAERAIRSAAALDWPRDRLEIQVLDDSDDPTTQIAQEAVDHLAREGVRATLIHRIEPSGYKAGALNAGLRVATGELVSVFDADFVPPPDFLRRTVPHLAEQRVACVQTRWGHLNENYSWLTRSLALALDSHFAVEQEVRGHHNLILSFNATSCLWRRSALEALGGWPTTTITEDLDLTLRALQAGLRFVYLDEPRVPCEIPVEVLGFARQQQRWARGGAQNLRLHARSMRSGQLTRAQRLDAWFHLAHYGFHPLLLLLLSSMLGLLWLGAAPAIAPAAAMGIAAALGPLLLLVEGQRRTHRRWPLRLWPIVPLTLLGIGICLRTSIAYCGGLFGRSAAFVRTPKFRITGRSRGWRGRAYVPAPDVITLLEVLIAAAAGIGAGSALGQGRILLALSLALFTVSFALVSVASVSELHHRSGPGADALRS